MRRVVITGLGIISPIGNSVDTFWNSLLFADWEFNKLSRYNDIDLGDYRPSSEIQNFRFEDYPDPLQSNSLKYALAAGNECLENSMIDIKGDNQYGTIIGTNLGCQDIIEKSVSQYELSEFMSAPQRRMLLNSKTSNISLKFSKYFNLKGTNFTVPTLCSSGNYAIATAYSYIKSGRSPLIFAGGTDSLTKINYSIFHSFGAITKDRCKPFDKNRQGIIVGEGCAILAIEDLEHAKARNAEILAEISGYGLSADAFNETKPEPQGKGAVLAINRALKTASILPEDISYISAHGTGTKANDISEANALAHVFGDKLKNIPVSATKSKLGHCMGGASAIEAVASVVSIKNQIIPPTINTTILDDQIPVKFDIVSKPQTARINHVLSNAFGFGGTICCVIFSKYSD